MDTTAPRQSAENALLLRAGVLLVVAVLLVPGVAADEPETSQESYTIPNSISWNQSELEVLIVPPTHGPLVGSGLQPLPDGPEGALPTGTYLEATLLAIDNWEYTMEWFAQQKPDYEYLDEVTLNVQVLLVDEVTSADVLDPDILVVYPEHATVVLGVAVYNPINAGPRCIASNTLWLTAESLNQYDMYKLAGHEFGHCLGLGHPSQPRADIMAQGGYPNHHYRCPSTLDMMGLTKSFAPAFDKGSGGGGASIPVEDYEQVCLPGLNTT